MELDPGGAVDWELRIGPDLAALGEAAAEIIIALLDTKPGAVLALPTGRTPLPVYGRLVTAVQEGRVSFSSAHLFLLDEFYPIASDHPASFRGFLERELVRGIDVDPARTHFFDGTVDDPGAECERIEAEIAAAGGLDLALLGIGENGHVAFNEPGTPFEVRTHVAELDQDTRRANAYLVSTVEDVPSRALTMGLATIMAAQRIVLIAAGTRKAEAVRDALEGPRSPETPASVLREHPDLRVLLDREAASCLSPDATPVQVDSL